MTEVHNSGIISPPPDDGQTGQQPAWLPLAKEIVSKLRQLTSEIYQTVPKEIRAHHHREALSGGTNWELTAWATGKHPAAFRMAALEVALEAIDGLVLNADEENRPTPKPKLARVRRWEDELSGR